MIVYKDTVQLAETVSDGYGDKRVVVLDTIPALFLQSTGSGHTSNADYVDADAHVYLDKDNAELLSRGYRIEGMYIIANPFGNAEDMSWYRIERVVVGQRKLLANNVDNVHAFLRKVAKLVDVGVVS